LDPVPRLDSPVAAAPPVPTFAERTVALVEVLICSDYPTQLLLGAALHVAGLRPETSAGELDIAYVAALSLFDSLALVGLIVLFLRAHGEPPVRVLLGDRPLRDEVFAGIPLMLVSLAIAIVALSSIQVVAPSLHTVMHNPLQDLLRTPRDTALFAVVVVVAGGVREEIQRAFLLHRFERWLGGGVVGVVAVSVAFGSGHLLQGVDAAIATGMLGAFWGVVYLRRRSAVAPMVAHSGFNLLQLGQFLVIGR
jgi:membrane protease YdiL (CAAX protease family)